MRIPMKLKGKSGIFLATTSGGLCYRFLNTLVRRYFILLIFLISFCANSQSRWRSYVGVYFTGDAEVYYAGPSILLGSSFFIKKDLSVSFYGHYFEKDFGDHSFKAGTVAILCQVNLGKRERFYIAVGSAWQRAIEEDDFYSDVINRSIIIPAFRVGHHFAFKKFTLSPEINATGPYIYNNGLELFTLPSIGVRLHF